MDRLTAMRVFAEVAASGSFTSTADRLDMSRAMVTRYVAELEQWLGARLLQRTTRRVSLTDAGESCLRRAQQMLALSEDLQEETARSSGGELRGQLRLTCSLSFGYAQLVEALGAFLALHPHLRLDLNVGDSALNLVEARVDLAIRISAEPDPLLIARPLALCESVLAASPDYLLRHGAPTAPADLAQHACLSHAHVGKTVWALRQGEQSVAQAVATRFSANDAMVLMRAAMAGQGIAMLPTYLAAPALRAGHLQAVLPAWQPPVLNIQALYPSRRHLSPAVRALLDFLVQHFQTATW